MIDNRMARQTEGWVIAYSALCIYAVTC